MSLKLLSLQKEKGLRPVPDLGKKFLGLTTFDAGAVLYQDDHATLPTASF